jgi:dihydroxyacetone kinase
MKHFFNRREHIVTEAIDGLLLTSGRGLLARLDTYPDIKVVLRADWDKSKVAVISGGGAGHEPSHAGFVGRGMLTAAVSGEIFASPSVDAVLAAIRAVTGPKGALLIVKNYTGDRLNFGLAAEKARTEGFNVEMVIVADDVAIPGINQPRGVAGTLFLHKIAGYHAEVGEDLKTVTARVAAAAGDIVSLGMSLSTCSVPGQAHEDRLGVDEGELGLGIHGEPGAERIALQPVIDIVATMAGRLAEKLKFGESYALLINNLGAVPPLEMGVIASAALSSSISKAVKWIVGPAPMMTALNMNGFSLSLLRLDATREAALTADVGPHAWVPAVERHDIRVVAAPNVERTKGKAAVASDHAPSRRLIRALCEHLVSLEGELNRLDSRVGDGDTGSTMAAGARSVLSRLDTLPLNEPAATMASVGDILSTSMGGSSGVLLSIFFTAAAKAMAQKADVAAALLAGLNRMTFYGGAVVGDRTMVDALAPALEALASGGLSRAAKAAEQGAESTKTMRKAKAGRASYVGERNLMGVPDPGAVAVAEVFKVTAGLL